MTRSLALLALFLVSLQMGCAPQSSSQSSGANSSTANGPNDRAGIEATNWSEVVMHDTNQATTNVDALGHFYTSKNHCMRAASGVMPAADWNRFVTLMNQVMASPPVAEYAMPFSEKTRVMDGKADVTMDPPTAPRRLLFEYKNGDILSTVKDQALAADLLGFLANMVVVADHEDCSSSSFPYYPQ